MAFDITLDAHSNGSVLGGAELGRQILDIRRDEHLTVAEIADRLNMSEARAKQLLRQSIHDYIAPEAEELRAVEAAKLDALETIVMERAREGHLPSIDRMLKIMQLRAVLFGLPIARSLQKDEEDGSQSAKVLDVQVWNSRTPAGADSALPAPGDCVDE
jgi:transcriptional regulator with XRE-family HTH domain